MTKINPEKVEKAVYLNNISQLGKIRINTGLKRLYFGDEFCPFRLPVKEELETAVKFAKKNKLGFTFVTPWLTDETFEKVEKLLKNIPAGFELVANDYSIFQLDRKKYGFEPVLGRLLNGQVRGLRANYEKRFSGSILEHFKSSQPQTEVLADFYRERGINRIELDNLPQGIKPGIKNMGFSGSLYYPYGYITVTRFCPYIVIKNRFGMVFSIKRCNKPCHKSVLYLYNEEAGKKIIVKGNTHFYKNGVLPKNLAELGINRLVEELI